MESKHGQTATDKITGFTGIVTGHADYITGCDQYLLQPKCKDEAWVESRWFDAGRLTFSDEEAIEAESVTGEKNGCDRPAPRK